MQQIDGTTALFSLCTAYFIFASALAFNLVGGFTKPSGGWIFAYSTLAASLGIIYKAFVGEPAQSNLLQPERTIEVFCAGITAVLLAAALNRRFRLKKSYLPNYRSDADLYRSSVACLFVGILVVIYTTLRTTETVNGDVVNILLRLASFLPLAAVLGITYELRRSDGRKSLNVVVVTALSLIFFQGILGYSKEGMYTPFACWLLPAAAQRARVSILQIAGFILAFAFVTYYLVPYSQYGRAFRVQDATFSENLKTSILLLSQLDTVRETANSRINAVYSDEAFQLHYYNQPQGLADRLQMITPDDTIINATEDGAVFGIEPVLFAFVNNIPHVIWPSKPTIGWGNVYAHEVGILTDEQDTTTGISFSPAGEAYHQARWVGVLIMLPLLIFTFFFTIDSLYGDTRVSPFSLLTMVSLLHSASEGGDTQFVAGFTMGPILTFFAAYLCTRFMPLIANLFIGPGKPTIHSSPPPQSNQFLFAATTKHVAE